MEREIIYPTIAAMSAEGRPIKGVLYSGLMLTTCNGYNFIGNLKPANLLAMWFMRIMV